MKLLSTRQGHRKKPAKSPPKFLKKYGVGEVVLIARFYFSNTVAKFELRLLMSSPLVIFIVALRVTELPSGSGATSFATSIGSPSFKLPAPNTPTFAPCGGFKLFR